DEILAGQEEVHKAALVGGLHAGMCFGVHYGHRPLPTRSDAAHAWAEVAPKYDVLMTRTEREIAFFAGFVPALRRPHDRSLTSPRLESHIPGIPPADDPPPVRISYRRHRLSGVQGARVLVDSRGDGSFSATAHSAQQQPIP